MGGNPGTGEEYLYCSPGETHIHLLLDVLIRHGIIHALRADMVVILDGGHFLDCQLKRCSRKRQQEQFLLRKASCPAALPFLKGLVVECFQFLMDCFIQFRKGQELTVTQGRQDSGGGHANGPLHKSLVLGTAGTGRENGGTVVLRHLLVGLVEHCFRSGILHHTGLEVIRREDAGDAAEIPIGVDMTGDPCLLLHVQKGLCVCVAAVWQHRYKQVGIQPLPSVRVHQSCRLPRPVHLHGLTGLVLQVHGGFRFVDIVRVILIELGGFVGQLAVLMALLTVFHPQQAQGDADLLHLTVYPLVVRHLVDRILLLGWK